MLRLPSVIEARVTGPDGQPVRDLLVTLDISVGSNYYFGTHLGLTDSEGIARTTADRIRSDFDLNRRTFPMDYKVPLEECDSLITVGVRGGTDFVVATRDALSSSLVAPSAKQNWKGAKNETVESTTVQIPIQNDDHILTSLTVARASDGAPA